MKDFSIRLIIGLFSFLIGISVTVLWMFYDYAPNVEISDRESQSKVETVITKLDPVAEQYAVYSVLIKDVSGGVLMINSQTSVDRFSGQTSVDWLNGRSPEQTFQRYDLTILPEFQSALK